MAQGYVLGKTAKSKKTRTKKAKKIIALLKEHGIDLSSARVLDIGTGAGYIANELSEHALEVDSTDIVDDRQVKDGFTQKIVEDEILPYDDNTFDVVISNHVLEHVPDQDRHISEIRRVLKDSGVVYLASPNKWWLTDPHYNLPFISWLPRKISSIYLALTKKRKWDIFSMSLKGVNKLTAKHGLKSEDMTWKVLTSPDRYGFNVPSSIQMVSKLVPSSLQRLLLNIMPTHLKLLRPEYEEA